MNRGDHFDPLARVLHWGMAVLILFFTVGMVLLMMVKEPGPVVPHKSP